jgi:uncharacterized membrane protein YcaP (DUF421 family)
MLVVLLRVSGKRTLSKLNAFDLVVTVALGSTLSSALLQQSVSIAGAALAFALLIGLQFIITWLSVRSAWFDQFVKSQPTVLFYEGRFLDAALKKERVTREELLSALRTQGISRIEEVSAVVIESNAELVCLRKWTPARIEDGDNEPSTLPESSVADADKHNAA